MTWRLAALIFFLAALPAAAQNCEAIKSGVDANKKPQNTGREIVGRSLDDIQEQGWMLFAIYEDFAPYSYNKNGELSGVDVDVARLIAKELGVEVGEVVAISESGGNMPIPVMRAEVMAKDMSMSLPGQERVEARINVTFKIVQ